MGDTGRAPDEGYTAGSVTIRLGGAALRQAAAEARQALLQHGAAHLQVAMDAVDLHDGCVVVRDMPARRVSFATLQGGQPFNCPA